MTNHLVADHFSVIHRLCTTRHMVTFQMIQNHQETVEVTIFNNSICYVNGKLGTFKIFEAIKNAIQCYQRSNTKWLHLYKYFVMRDMIGCVDIFQHLKGFYLITLQ